MPTKSKTAKSRTSKTGLTKRKGFQFKWWMGVALVLIVALVGIIVLRYSRAANGPIPPDAGTIVGGPYTNIPYNGYYGGCDHYSILGHDLCLRYLPGNYYQIGQFNGQTRCYVSTPTSVKPTKVTLWEIGLGFCSG